MGKEKDKPTQRRSAAEGRERGFSADEGCLHWAKRVSLRKVIQLYESDAMGALDAELLDEVGVGFYARVCDMFEIDAASRGKVACRGCGWTIAREAISNSKSGRIFLGKDKKNDELLVCEKCGWEIAWSTYYESYSGKNLLPNASLPFLERFMEEWPKARTPKAKMLLIDWIVHQFHLQYEASIPMRPTAVNLLEGSSDRILATLEALAYSEKSCAPESQRQEFHAGLTNRYRVFMEKNGGISGVHKMAAALGIPHAGDIPVSDLIDIINQRTK